jgi:hypothetical protein
MKYFIQDSRYFSRDTNQVYLKYESRSYCYPNPLGNSLEQSPHLEAGSRSATNKAAKLVRNLKSHYRVHKRLPLAPILSPIN